MRDRWEILANFKMQAVPQKQIAEVLGVSEGAVSQEVNSPEFQAFYTEHLTKHSKQSNDLDEGWDALEKITLGNLLEVAGYVKDPRLMLQISMVANKAQRRQSRFNHPLDAAAAGARPVVIQMRSTYIEKMQIGAPPVPGDRAKLLDGDRSVNIPSPSRIERAFSQPMEIMSIEEQAEQMLDKVVVNAK